MANDMKLQFNIGATFSELKSAVTQAKAEIKSLVDTVKKAGQDVKVKVSLDITGLNTDIQHLKTTIRTALQGSATEKIKVKIEADVAAIKADIAAIKPQIQSALSSFAPISLTINHAKLASHLKAAEAQVNAAIARMASPGAALKISLNVDTMSTGLIAALNALKVEVNALKTAFNRGGLGGGRGGGSGGGGGLGGASSDVSGFASALRDAKTQLMQLVGAFGLMMATMGFVRITDEAKSLESKLKLVTSSQEELNKVTAALREIAKNNLQSLAPTVELYSKLSSGTKNLEGANTALNTRLTDIVSKLVTISGSTGPAAEGAIIQFGQALSGNFSAAGQELNSIIEQAPALADAIAKSYGVTKGELKKLGEAGIITAAGVVNGLIRQGKEVDGLFGKVNNTIGGTATTTSEALKKMIVEMDEAIGLSKLMIDALVLIRDHTAELKLVLQLVGAALLGAFSFAVITQIGGIIAAVGAGLTVSLIGLVIQARIAGTSLLAAFGARLLAGIASVNIALVSLRGIVASIALVFAALAIGEYLFNESLKVRLFAAAFMKTWEEIFIKLKGGFSVLGKWIVFSFKNPIDRIRIEIAKLITAIAMAIDAVNPFGSSVKNALLELANFVMPKSKAFDEFNKQIAETRANTASAVKEIAEKYDTVAQMEIDNQYNKNKEVIDEDLGIVSPKASKLKPNADKNELNKDRLTNDLDNLEKRYSAEKIKLNDYFRQRKQLTEQLHDLEIKSINDKYNAEVAAKTKAAKSKYDEDVALANKIKVEDAKQKALKIAKANYEAATVKKDDDVKKEAKKNTDVEKAKIAKEQAVFTVNFDWKEAREQAKKKSEEMAAELKLDAIKDKFDKTDAEIKDKKEKSLKKFKEETLEGYEDQAEAAKRIADYEVELDKHTNQALAKNNLARIQEEIKVFTDGQANKVKSFELQREKGKISNADAKLETDIVNEKTRDRLALYIAELERLAPTSKEAQAALEELRLKMLDIPPKKDTEAELKAFWNNINKGAKETAESAAKSGLSQYFLDIADGVGTANSRLKSFANNFAQAMAKMAADALAAWAVMKLVGLVGGFSGGGAAPRVDAPNLTANANVAHTGGIAGGALASRKVDMSLFTAAPRYHVGGIAGLQPGEVPAILQRGEEVLTQKDPRHVANGGGQGGGVRIINNIDPSMMHDYLSSSSGEQVIVNLIERNSGTIKQLLG